MKILTKKEKKGLIVIQMESLNDLWILYNIISEGDLLDGKTSRRVVHKDCGDQQGERKQIYLKIRVEQVEFHEFSNRLRVKGKIVEGPEDLIKINTYHTFNIDDKSKIGIIKDEWTPLHLKLLRDAEKYKTEQKILVILLDSEEATFGEIGDYYQKLSLSISSNIPGKRFGNVKESNNAKNAYFSTLLKNMEHMLKMSKYNHIIIGGPGFMKDRFKEYVIKKHPELGSKILVESTSSATVSGIHEIIKKKTIQNFIKDAKILQDTRLVEEFLARLGKNSGDIAYGIEDIKKAAEIGAIEQLL
ncbi:MAG: mRNA surveillance protein pelota, partial [Promethearchaeota archaeon]